MYPGTADEEAVLDGWLYYLNHRHLVACALNQCSDSLLITHTCTSLSNLHYDIDYPDYCDFANLLEALRFLEVQR